jgi:hypothetical protein
MRVFQPVWSICRCVLTTTSTSSGATPAAARSARKLAGEVESYCQPPRQLKPGSFLVPDREEKPLTGWFITGASRGLGLKITRQALGRLGDMSVLGRGADGPEDRWAIAAVG